jgi:hypothetical protein
VAKNVGEGRDHRRDGKREGAQGGVFGACYGESMANERSGEVMDGEGVSTMSDGELVARLQDLLREERRLTAAVLVHLGEVEARELYLPAACPSMHTYCTRVLGMSDDQVYKRIRAARAVRRFPVVGTAVADGRLHLGGVLLLAAHLTDGSADELVAEASGKSKAEIEVLLARRAPKPDVAARLERVAQQTEMAPGPVGPEKSAAKVTPLAPERFALQLTISGARCGPGPQGGAGHGRRTGRRPPATGCDRERRAVGGGGRSESRAGRGTDAGRARRARAHRRQPRPRRAQSGGGR